MYNLIGNPVLDFVIRQIVRLIYQQPPAYAGGLLCDAAHQPMSTSKFSHSEFSILAYIYQFTLVVLRSNYKIRNSILVKPLYQRWLKFVEKDVVR